MSAASLIGRVLVAALFVGCATYSTMLSLENNRFATVVRASRILKTNDQGFTSDQLEQLVKQADLASVSTCRSDVLDPALTVYLAFASRQDQIKDYEAWARAIEGADAFVKHMIRCLPADGDAWTREALIAQSVAENPAQLADEISVGASLSPNELGQVRARLSLWSRVSPATRDAAAPLLDMDVRTILNHGDRGLVTMLYGSNSLRPLAENAATTLEPERRAKIEKFVKDMSR
jgi:hypothetical protein